MENFGKNIHIYDSQIFGRWDIKLGLLSIVCLTTQAYCIKCA
jgi:hypothetical protein